MYTIGEALKSERLRLGMNQDDFAAAGGVKKRTQISYEYDERCPDGLYFRAVAAIGVDVQYVITGSRSSSALTSDEDELLAGYRALDIRGKAGMLGMIEGLAPIASKPQSDKPSPFANTITGKKAQVIQGVNHGTISSGKIINKVERKKKDAL
jgi:transcriptional regulator with XRE-family HTH domain